MKMLKIKLTVFALSLAALAAVLLAMPGCAHADLTARSAHAIHAAGSHADQAGAYVKSAQQGVTSAKAHADAAGQALLGVVTTNHAAALSQLSAVDDELAAVERSVRSLGDQIASLTAENDRLVHSWGHRLQVVVTRLVILLLILAGLHVIGAAVAILAPPPYSVYAGIVAKVVNPLGWGTWAVSRFAAEIDRVTKPDGTPAKPIHAVIEPPK